MNFQNIEKSAFQKGEYVGYANGVWSIFKRGNNKGWHACRGSDRQSIFGKSLKEISEKLVEVSDNEAKREALLPNPFLSGAQ